jgi:hypothetical protein
MTAFEQEHGCRVSDDDPDPRACPAPTHRCYRPGPDPSGAAAGACLQRNGPRTAEEYLCEVGAYPHESGCSTHPSPFITLAVSFMIPVNTLTFSFTQPCSPNSQ